MNIVNLKLQKIEDKTNSKAKYLFNGKSLFAEDSADQHYRSLGYEVIWSENKYWLFLFGLLFWDVIFAKVKGSVKVISKGVTEDLFPESSDFNEQWEFMVNKNGMPADLFSDEFFRNREAVFENRKKELSVSNLDNQIRISYQKHFGMNFRMIDDWYRYSIDDLCIAPKVLPKDILLNLLLRIAKNVNENRSGLPDLFIYNDKEAFFTEVKSEKDRLSEKQKDWIDYIESIGIRVDLLLINHSEQQVENIQNKQNLNKLVKISFGYSSSKKREDAIAFIQKQSSFFTSGEGKDQIYGAFFDINDIENLYLILDLTSGWKSQVIEINGKQIKSSDLRDVLWCFREKKKIKASNDYCRENQYSGEANSFGCRLVYMDDDCWNEYGYINTDSGIWIFNEEALEEYKNQIIAKYSYCPLFKKTTIEKIFSNLPKTINPATDKDWAYLSNDHNKWFIHNGKYYGGFGNTVFPGISTMVGICKISKEDRNYCIQAAKETEEYEKYEDNNEIIFVNQSEPSSKPLQYYEEKINEKSSRKSGCFIATAVYGDYDSPQVLYLRSYRDNNLSKSFIGKFFVKIYYLVSPSIANYISNKKRIKKVLKSILDLIIKQIKKNNKL